MLLHKKLDTLLSPQCSTDFRGSPYQCNKSLWNFTLQAKNLNGHGLGWEKVWKKPGWKVHTLVTIGFEDFSGRKDFWWEDLSCQLQRRGGANSVYQTLIGWKKNLWRMTTLPYIWGYFWLQGFLIGGFQLSVTEKGRG